MSTVPYAVRSSRWRAVGLCSQCGGTPIAGRKLCERHAEKSRRANGWASSQIKAPPAGVLARAYLDLLNQYGPRRDEEPHRIHLREMRETTRGGR